MYAVIRFGTKDLIAIERYHLLDMEIPLNLTVIMISSGIVFIGSICSLIYGIRMPSDTPESNKDKEKIDATGKYSDCKIGRHILLSTNKSK